MRVILCFILVTLFFSCERETVAEREVNAMHRNIQRRWQFTTMETTGPIADSARVELVSASVDWNGKCRYEPEEALRSFCESTGDFNNLEVSYRYGYDASLGKYLLVLDYMGSETDDSAGVGQDLEHLINGKWEFTVEGDNLTARQLNNEVLPGVLTTLKARAM